MAKGNEVVLTFAGDSEQLEKTFDKVGEAAKDMGGKVGSASRDIDETGGAVGRMGEKADGAETSLIGIHDVIDGTATIMQGPGEQGIVAYTQGWADLAGGLAPLLIQLGTFQSATIKTAAIQVASAARAVASWVVMGVTAMANAVMIAAAWVISLGPVVLVIAAVVAVVAVFALLWTRSAAFRNFWAGLWGHIKSAAGGAKDWIVGRFNSLIGFFKSLPGRAGAAFSGLFNGVKSAFRAAVNWVIDRWNNFSIPGINTHIPGIGTVGGFETPNLPRFHSGGTVPGAPGSEMLALLQAGERITPAGAAAAPTMIEIRSGGSRLDELLVEILAKAISSRGGDVQAVLGGR